MNPAVRLVTGLFTLEQCTRGVVSINNESRTVVQKSAAVLSCMHLTMYVAPLVTMQSVMS